MEFESIFTKTNNDKILEKLEEIKELMVPKVIYVPYPVYITKEPWWYCEPLEINYPHPEVFKTYWDYGCGDYTGTVACT